MKKKSKLVYFILVIGIIIVICPIWKLNKSYDINASIKSVKINNSEELKKYHGFLLKYISPKKLANFSNYNDISVVGYTEKANGYTVLDDMKYDAYRRMFNRMFDKDRENFDDCPVTDSFKKKFNTNLFKYFDLKNSDSSLVDSSLDKENKTLDVTEAGDFVAGEPGYIYYHHFHYVLDEEGNVDDVIFDYTE